MKQHVSNPPEHESETKPTRALLAPASSKGGIVLFLLLICVLLAISGRQILRAWPTGTQSKPVSGGQSAVPRAPLQAPGGVKLASFQLPSGHTLVYEQSDHIVTVSTSGGSPRVLETPGYQYNRAVPAVVTSTKELIYSGEDGIWVLNLAGGQARKLAALSSDQILTSLVVSKDGTNLAWSSAPQNGKGTITIAAGPLDHTARIYQQTAATYPCYRAFAFLSTSNNTLLLTDDRGDHRSAHFGLWSVDLNGGEAAQPQPILSADKQQGPLVLSPQGNALLYSTFQGYVPMQEENAPADIVSLSYANSLSVASMNGAQPRLGPTQTIVPEQRDLENTMDYQWIATPQFAPDSQQLAYVGFSVRSQKYFPRLSSLYLASLQGQPHGEPTLLVNSTAHYIELGSWINDHIVTVYADNALYALDVQNNTVASVANTGAYAHVIAVIE